MSSVTLSLAQRAEIIKLARLCRVEDDSLAWLGRYYAGDAEAASAACARSRTSACRSRPAGSSR